LGLNCAVDRSFDVLIVGVSYYNLTSAYADTYIMVDKINTSPLILHMRPGQNRAYSPLSPPRPNPATMMKPSTLSTNGDANQSATTPTSLQRADDAERPAQRNTFPRNRATQSGPWSAREKDWSFLREDTGVLIAVAEPAGGTRNEGSEEARWEGPESMPSERAKG